MAQRYADRVVWITGGGTGIGRALALELGRQGARVAVSGRRLRRLREVADAITKTGGEALAVGCDATDSAQVAETVAHVLQRWHRLDVAVANAGYAVSGRFEKLALQDWRRQFEINVFGLVETSRIALPELRRTSGRLVLTASAVAFGAFASHGPYCASKAAVRAIGDTLAIELAGSGVSCTTVYPGYVESEIFGIDKHGRLDPVLRERRTPKHFMWSAERAAKVIAKAVHNRQRQCVVTGHGRLLTMVSRHCPAALHYPQVLAQMWDAHKRERRSEPGHG